MNIFVLNSFSVSSHGRSVDNRSLSSGCWHQSPVLGVWSFSSVSLFVGISVQTWESVNGHWCQVVCVSVRSMAYVSDLRLCLVLSIGVCLLALTSVR